MSVALVHDIHVQPVADALAERLATYSGSMFRHYTIGPKVDAVQIATNTQSVLDEGSACAIVWLTGRLTEPGIARIVLEKLRRIPYGIIASALGSRAVLGIDVSQSIFVARTRSTTAEATADWELQARPNDLQLDWSASVRDDVARIVFTDDRAIRVMADRLNVLLYPRAEAMIGDGGVAGIGLASGAEPFIEPHPFSVGSK